MPQSFDDFMKTGGSSSRSLPTFDEFTNNNWNQRASDQAQSDNAQMAEASKVSDNLELTKTSRDMETKDQQESYFRKQIADQEALQQQKTQDTDAAFRQEQRQTLPGRDLPVIGPVLKFADWVASNPISQATAEYTPPDQPMFSTRMPGESFFRDDNLQGITARENFLNNSGQEAATGASKFIGQAAAPFFVPGVGLGTGSALRGGAEALTSRIAPGLGQNVAREAAIGAGIGFGSEYAQGQGDLGQAAITGAAGAALGGAFPLAGKGLQSIGEKYAGTKIGDYINRFFDNGTPAVEPTTAEPLALPLGRGDARLNAANERSNLPYGSEPVAPYGESPTLALPEGNYIPQQRLRVEDPTTMLNSVMTKIKPEVEQIIAVPERRDLLINYIQRHTDMPVQEIHNMPMATLQSLGQDVRQGLDIPQIAFDAARKHGYDLPALLDGQAPNVAERVAQDAQKRAYGVYPDKLPTLRQPEGFNISKTGQAAAPETKVGFRQGEMKQAPRPTLREAPQPLGRDIQPAAREPVSLREPSTERLKPSKNTDELGFAQTVRTSENTPQSLSSTIDEIPLVGTRTSDALNRQQANDLITKHGNEGLYGILMGKTKQFSASETTAAQILAKQYSSLGGEANLSKSIDLVSKTAKGGREMGQAIQALSQWNKLDETGALLLGERQLNKGITNTSEWKKLSTAQAAPITEAAQRIGTAQETKNLANDVLNIVTNKQAGEALTDAEKATIKQFHEQVKDINGKTKPFLPQQKGAKVNSTIEQVAKIEPKERTRDQVVSFLDAKAEQARQRIAASRNIGFAAQNKGNPVVDWSIIGASHIAKGVVKLSDFTEQMVRDFGESIKPHIDEVFTRATNMFRRENGLPSVQELDRAVNGAIKKGTFTEEEANRFKAWASEIGHMSDEFKTEATQDLHKAMNEIGTSTFGQKLATIQTSAQLLSAPTALRNVVGNEAFNILAKINKITSIPIDWSISKITGERSIAFLSGNQEKYWTNFVKGAVGGWKGVSPNGQFAAYDIHPEAFKSDLNPFKYLQKATGAMLQSFDHAAYRRAYGTVLGEYSKITGKPISELDQAIHDLADEAGRYATFQDDTFLSKIATGTKRLLNKPTDMAAEALVNKGVLPESLSWKGFGTGDLVLKYAKTPANIIMRGIEYSPIGFFRGLGELIPLLTKKEFNQRQAVLSLSRGITGTLGLSGLGFSLASAGILTGSAGNDPDIRSLDQQTGKGEYKVNWSALQRYVLGGLDQQAAKWQKGDRIFDWGWMQPMAISIAMGVNAQQSAAKQKEQGTKSYVATARDGLIGSLKTIMQQPLLSGVQNVVSGVTSVAKYGSWSGIANIFKGAPASFVPALSNQARNFTDNTGRVTYDPNGWKEALNMVINRIPGLDKQLPVAYDTLGNAKEQVQDGQANTLAQGLKTFGSPVKMTDYTVTPEAKMIIDLINSTGDDKVAPRSPKKYLMVDKKKVELTADQYSEIQKRTGEETKKALASIAPTIANPNIKDENKVKEVINVLDKVGQRVRSDLNRKYPEFRPTKAAH